MLENLHNVYHLSEVSTEECLCVCVEALDLHQISEKMHSQVLCKDDFGATYLQSDYVVLNVNSST